MCLHRQDLLLGALPSRLEPAAAELEPGATGAVTLP